MSLSSATLAASFPTPERARRNSQTAGYFAAFIALGLTIGSFGPTLPGLAVQTRTRLSEISFLFTARSLGYVLGSFYSGRLFDRVPGHLLMACALLMMAVMMALVPLLPMLWLLTVALLLLGGAESALDVGGNALLVRVHGSKVGPFMNGLHFFFGVGAFLSPIIVAQALYFNHGIRLSYWTLALLLPPVAVWLLRLPGPPLQADSKNQSAGHTSYRLILLIALFLFLYVGAEVSFGGWIYTYTVALKLSNAPTAAYLTSAFWGSLTLGRLSAIPLSVRLRPRMIMLADLAGCLLSVAVIMLWPGSFAATLTGTIGLGFSMASIFPTTLALAERRMTITGRVTGWFIVGASSGSMLLPWLIGQFFETTGPRITMLIIMSTLLAAAGVFVILLSSAQPKRRESAGE